MMRTRATLTTAALTAAGLLLTACGGSTDATSTGNAATSTEASTPAVDETPEASDPAIPEPTPTAEPTPSGPTPITSDDLIDVLPRPGQMSNIQDRKFKRNTEDYPDEPGADWAADAPLTKRQRGQINLGELRKTKPAVCQYLNFMDAGYMAAEWSGQDYITAAARSSMYQEFNLSNFRRTDQLMTFDARIYVMPPGEASIWADNAANTIDRCARYKQVNDKGKITNVQTPKSTLRSNGSTYVWTINSSARGSGNISSYDVWEVVGNALLKTRWFLANATKAGDERAVKVYNNMADKLANVQGVTRPPLVLDALTKVKQDPGKVQDPTRPASSLA